MILDRRTLLAAASGFTICWPAAFAETAPPVLDTYEREKFFHLHAPRRDGGTVSAGGAVGFSRFSKNRKTGIRLR